jgi:predicted RNA-binding Zn-ribbon protein involved in translation (DUF1610 family)
MRAKNKVVPLGSRCVACGGKIATDILGREYCPQCVGKQMADRASRKLKLELKI